MRIKNNPAIYWQKNSLASIKNVVRLISGHPEYIKSH